MQEFTVSKKAITPMIHEYQTQIIFQRHCNYNKDNGSLKKESIEEQKKLVKDYLSDLTKTINREELKNTYFLFTSSNTSSGYEHKRCVETTDIAMNEFKIFLKDNNMPTNHIINLNENSNYKNKIHEANNLTEPKMFTDNTGYLDYLKKKHNGMNLDFWIDFEEDLSIETRKQLGAEGPDEIVKRFTFYINALIRYANYFKEKHPNNRLIIWNGTHYDLISPFVKLKILNWEKSDVVNVDYLGGISFSIDNDKTIININGTTTLIDFQDKKPLHRHF